MRDDYVHGYSKGEANRLVDQANTLANPLHKLTLNIPHGVRF